MVFKIKNIVIAILIPLLALVTVQLCLRNPQTRELFTNVEKYENISYSGITEVEDASVNIEVEGEIPSGIEVLFNGSTVVKVTSEKTTINAQCSGIIEIKNNSGFVIKAAVSCADDNVNLTVINTEFKPGISTLCAVRFGN